MKVPPLPRQTGGPFFETYTRGLTKGDLGKLFTRDTLEAYRFFSRHIDFEELKKQPWHLRMLGHARLLGLDALQPDPGEALELVLAADGEGEAVVRLHRFRQREGDAADVILGTKASAEARQELRRKLGLDQSIPVQYVRWISRVVQGDWGYSIRTGPVRVVPWGASWSDRPAAGRARGRVTVRRLGEFRASVECEEHGQTAETTGWSTAREHQEAGSESFCAVCRGEE